MPFYSDVSYFGPYAETKNNGSERKVCMKWIQFRSWFRPFGAEVSSLIIQKFSSCFSLSFNASVDVVGMFLSCSMMMIFLWLLRSWSCLLKCYSWLYGRFLTFCWFDYFCMLLLKYVVDTNVTCWIIYMQVYIQIYQQIPQLGYAILGVEISKARKCL